MNANYANFSCAARVFTQSHQSVRSSIFPRLLKNDHIKLVGAFSGYLIAPQIEKPCHFRRKENFLLVALGSPDWFCIMSDEKIGIGLVGAGWMGAMLLRAYCGTRRHAHHGSVSTQSGECRECSPRSGLAG